jgi:hypothetical protein
MNNLLKLEYRRYVKDKTFWIAVIVGLGITFVVALLFGFINSTLKDVGGEGLSGLLIFQSSLSGSSYISYLVSITGLIILIKDYNHGTLRAKIVAGYSRAQVYFSSYIVFISFALGITFLSAFFGLGVGSLFLGVQGITFSAFFESFGLGFLWMTFTYTFLFFLASAFKAIGGPLGITIGVLVFFSFVATIVPTLAYAYPSFENIDNVLYFIPFYQINAGSGALSSLFGTGSLESKRLLIVLVTNVVYSAGLVALGYTLYIRSDLR